MSQRLHDTGTKKERGSFKLATLAIIQLDNFSYARDSVTGVTGSYGYWSSARSGMIDWLGNKRSERVTK
jgi:hypothetical protein